MVARGFVVRTFLRLSGGRFRAERDDLAGLCVDQDFGDILTLRPNDIEGPDERGALSQSPRFGSSRAAPSPGQFSPPAIW